MGFMSHPWKHANEAEWGSEQPDIAVNVPIHRWTVELEIAL